MPITFNEYKTNQNNNQLTAGKGEKGDKTKQDFVNLLYSYLSLLINGKRAHTKANVIKDLFVIVKELDI